MDCAVDGKRRFGATWELDVDMVEVVELLDVGYLPGLLAVADLDGVVRQRRLVRNGADHRLCVLQVISTSCLTGIVHLEMCEVSLAPNCIQIAVIE